MDLGYRSRSDEPSGLGVKLGGTIPQGTYSTGAGLFKLPIEIRYNIYGLVLSLSQPLYVFQQSNSRVETFAPSKPFRWLALLSTNRQIHDEGSVALYGTHNFIFVDTTHCQLHIISSFLDGIGTINASLVSHLCINFPFADVVSGQASEAKFKEDGLRTLRILREKCTSLNTLELFVHSENARGLSTSSGGRWDFIKDAILQIDAQLNAMASLNNVIIRSYCGSLVPSVAAIIQGLGWVILPGI
jgi:hypothetical protein